MKSSCIYSMILLDEYENTDYDGIFLMAFDGEERSYYGWNQMQKKGNKYNALIILDYTGMKESDLGNIVLEQGTTCRVQKISQRQIEFINILKQLNEISVNQDITIDISSLRTPDIFLLLKYLKIIQYKRGINIINTIPFDYIFKGQPFLSYRSYLGDLELREIIGYSGNGDMTQEVDLYMFLGFEGTLSLKVIEETVYKNLYLINTLPSYYQKYKDISVINNYNIITSKNNKLLYAPANNPFEVYNILDQLIIENRTICIAPLCTKPISLGVCMYALEHENVRIIYPVSDLYNELKSKSVHMAYMYKIYL